MKNFLSRGMRQGVSIARYNIIIMKNFPIHGANPENLYRFFNVQTPEKILDFSTNTNIFSDSLTDSIFDLDVKNLVSNYPDPTCKKLREIIAEREKISPEKILFTNGTNEAIFLLANLLRSRSSVIFQPCYSEYVRAFIKAENIFIGEGSTITPRYPAKTFNINVDTTEVVSNVFITANPNNPIGYFMDNLSGLIKKYPGVIFVVDEAYIDFLIGGEPERLCDFENVVLLRSLTKFYHLSGARIGYVIANEYIINALKNFQPAWSVNAVAQELALRFLNDKDFYENSRNFYKENTPVFMDKLKDSGFQVIDSDVHFFMIKVEKDEEIMKLLLESGIVVRHTRNFLGLKEKYIRVATKRPEENEFFIETLTNIRNSHLDYF